MRLTVNGEHVEHDGSITDLLVVRLADPRPPGVAVAVDGEVVPRDLWSRCRLAPGAVVEIVTAVQGG
jgi:sulfur carrier protein